MLWISRVSGQPHGFSVSTQLRFSRPPNWAVSPPCCAWRRRSTFFFVFLCSVVHEHLFPRFAWHSPLLLDVVYSKFRGPVCKIPRLTTTIRFWVNWALSCQRTSVIEGWHCVQLFSNIQRKLSIFFFSKVQSLKSNCVYLWLCAVLRWLLVELTVLGSSVWFFFV